MKTEREREKRNYLLERLCPLVATSIELQTASKMKHASSTCTLDEYFRWLQTPQLKEFTDTALNAASDSNRIDKCTNTATKEQNVRRNQEALNGLQPTKQWKQLRQKETTQLQKYAVPMTKWVFLKYP